MLSNIHFFAGEFDLAHEHAGLAINIAQQIGYMQSESLGVSTLGLLASIEDEDYQMGLDFGQRASQLAEMSNVTMSMYAHVAIALACCGLRRFERARDHLQRLADLTFFRQSLFRLGPIAALGSVFCYETGAYQKATRYLGTVLNGSHAYFGWAKKWQFLQRLNNDLRTQLDEATFSRMWDEGREMPLDDVAKQILHDMG